MRYLDRILMKLLSLLVHIREQLPQSRFSFLTFQPKESTASKESASKQLAQIKIDDGSGLRPVPARADQGLVN